MLYYIYQSKVYAKYKTFFYCRCPVQNRKKNMNKTNRFVQNSTFEAKDLSNCCVLRLWQNIICIFQYFFSFRLCFEMNKSTLNTDVLQNLHNTIEKIKGYIILGLLCTLAVQQTVLISSSDTNTVITSPPGVNIGLSTFHEASSQYANYIGFGAKWVYKAGSQSWPVGDTATFVTQFYADCQSPATLIACADNEFAVSVNGAAVVTGSHFNAKSYIPIKLNCGLNTLVFVVKNRDNGSPAGLIFAVTQDQSKCYTCLTPLSFYNRDTCRCECTQGCKCAPANRLFTWKPYPVCGCTCAVTRKCQDYQYWNDKTCSCKCKKIVCPTNQIQDSKTCKCKGKCLPFRACNPGQIWDFDECRCIRLDISQQCDDRN